MYLKIYYDDFGAEFTAHKSLKKISKTTYFYNINIIPEGAIFQSDSYSS